MALATLSEPNNLKIFCGDMECETLIAQNIQYSGTEIVNLQVKDTLVVGDDIANTSGKIEIRGGQSGKILLTVNDSGPTSYSLELPSAQPDLEQVLTVSSFDSVNDRYVCQWTDKTELPSSIEFLTVDNTLRVGTLPNTGRLQLNSQTGRSLIFQASPTATDSYTVQFPPTLPVVGQLLQITGNNANVYTSSWVSPPSSFQNLVVTDTTTTSKIVLSESNVSLESQTGGEAYSLELPANLPTVNQVMAVTGNNDNKYQLSFVNQVSALNTFVPKAYGGTVQITTQGNTKCNYQVMGNFCFFRMTVQLQDITGVTLSDFFNVELPIEPVTEAGEIYYIHCETTNLFSVSTGEFYDNQKSSGYISSGSKNMYVIFYPNSSSSLLNFNYIAVNNIQNVIFSFNGFYRVL